MPYLYGIRVKGIQVENPSAETDKSTIWGSGRNEAAHAALEHPWVFDKFVRHPENTEHYSGLFDYQIFEGAHEFALEMDAQVARAFQRKPNFLGRLAIAIDEDDTAITLTEDSDIPSHGDVIYFGKEAVRVGTVINNVLFSCTRGYLDTQAQGHDASVGYFDHPATLKGLDVDLVLHDFYHDTETVIWRGIVRSTRPETYSATLILSCEGVLEAAKQHQNNANAFNLNQSQSLTYRYIRNEQGYEDVLIEGEVLYESRILRTLGAGLSGYIILEIDGAPARVFLSVDGRLDLQNLEWLTKTRPKSAKKDQFFTDVKEATRKRPSRHAFFSEIETRSTETSETSAKPFTGEVFEVFYVDKELDEKMSGVVSTTFGIAPAKPYNPLYLAWCLLIGQDEDLAYDGNVGLGLIEGDNLKRDFGLGLFGVLDYERWWKEYNRCPFEIDQFHLGSQGKSFSVLDVVVNQLLRPFGYNLFWTDEAKLAPKRVGLPSVHEYEAARANARSFVSPKYGGTWTWSNAQKTPIIEAQAKVGGNPYGEKASNFTLESKLFDANQFLQGESASFDLSVLRAPTLSYLGDLDDTDLAINRILNFSILSLVDTPRVRITVERGEPIHCGDYIAFTDTAQGPFIWPLRDGTIGRLPNDTLEEKAVYLGFVTGKKSLIQQGLENLQVHLLNYSFGEPILLIAPSAKIDTITDQGGGRFHITLDDGNPFEANYRLSNETKYPDGSSISGSITEEILYFRVGDGIYLVDHDGSEGYSGMLTIAAKTNTYLQADAASSGVDLADLGWSGSEEWYVQLSKRTETHANTYQSDKDLFEFSEITLPWSFMSNAKLGGRYG